MMNKQHLYSWRDGLHFLWLLPVFFVLHGFILNFPMVEVRDAFLLLLKYLTAATLLLFIFYFLFRSIQRGALMTFGMMCIFLFFGAAHDLLKRLFPGTFIIKYTFLLPAILWLTIILFFLVRRKNTGRYTVSRYLNVGLLLLCFSELLTAIFAGTHRSVQNDGIRFERCDTCRHRDIYVIVADGYPGSEALQTLTDYDNHPFLDSLSKQGFQVVDSSISNYNYTPFSMASMFNMEFLPKLEGRNQSRADRKICYALLDDNNFFRFLKDAGYEFRNLSIFRVNGKPPLESTSFYKVGSDIISAETLTGRINSDIRFNLVTRFKIRSEIARASYAVLELNRRIHAATIEESKTQRDKPRLVYTHLEMPHYPYYFDSTGSPNPVELLLSDSFAMNKPAFLSYLKYVNAELLKLVTEIRKNTQGNAIVLLMSDHGAREIAMDEKLSDYHFRNLNAVFLPSGAYQHFYSGMSNVNQLRVLLNSCFRQHLPLLPDSTVLLKE